MFWNHHSINGTEVLENLFVFGKRMYLLFREAWALCQLTKKYVCILALIPTIQLSLASAEA